MFPFLRPSGRDDGAQQALDRAVALLRRYERAGATALPVADVLEMLGGGTGPTATTQGPPRDPQADPITGARWAGPAGSVPPGS